MEDFFELFFQFFPSAGATISGWATPVDKAVIRTTSDITRIGHKP